MANPRLQGEELAGSQVDSLFGYLDPELTAQEVDGRRTCGLMRGHLCPCPERREDDPLGGLLEECRARVVAVDPAPFLLE
jgi:hypothetical protein